MVMTPTSLQLAAAADRILRLIKREVSLREAGRHLEINPSCSEEAAWLFGRADETRAERLELVERCGLS